MTIFSGQHTYYQWKAFLVIFIQCSSFIILNKELSRMGKGKRDKQKQIEQRREMRKHDKQTKKNMRKKMGKGDKFKLAHEYVQYYEQFDSEMAVLGLRLRDVGGDGNCLFRSISDQIDGNQTTHIFMRDQACKFILKNQDFFKNYLDEDQQGTVQQYTQFMRKNGQWGGHLQIQALSQCFRSIVVVHKKNLQQYYITPLMSDPMGGFIHLAYFQTQDFEHYLSIRAMDDFSDEPAANRLKQLNTNMYQHLMYMNDPDQTAMMKQLGQLQIGQKQDDQQQQQQALEQPYPNYPKNKKCKCGSNNAYKSCCFKEYQRKLAKNY